LAEQLTSNLAAIMSTTYASGNIQKMIYLSIVHQSKLHLSPAGRGPSRPILPRVIVEECSWSFLNPHSNLAKLVLALVVAHNTQKKANLARYSRFGGSRLAASEFPKVFDLTLFLGMEIDGESCALLTRLCSSVSIILFHRLRHSLAPQPLSRNISL